MHGLSSIGGQLSWIGTLSDGTSNSTMNTALGFRSFNSMTKFSQLESEKGTNTNDMFQSHHFIDMNFQFSSSHRMLSTSSSSTHSGSKMQDTTEDRTITGSNSDKTIKDTSSSAQITDVDESKPQAMSFQSMLRQYGKIFIGTYLTVYVSTILSLFMSVQSGQIDAMYMISLLTGTSAPADPGGVADPDTIKEATSAMKDLVKLLEKYTITRPVAPMVEEYPWTANFAIAWIATKFTEPIRFGVTVAVTPPIARYLGYKSTTTAVQNSPIEVVSKRGDTSHASDSATTVKTNHD